MAIVILRATKGVPLTSTEVDNNFSYLNTELATVSGSTNSVTQILSNKTLLEPKFKGTLTTGGYINSDGNPDIGSGNFDGTSYVTLQDDNNAGAVGTGDFTIDFWFYHTTYNYQNKRLFGKGQTGGSIELELSTGNGSGSLVLYMGGFFSNLSATILPSTWYWVAISRTSGVLSVYLNGQKLTGSNETTFFQGQSIGSANLVVGGGVAPGSSFTGKITSFRFINGVGLHNNPNGILVPTSESKEISGTQTKVLLLFDNIGSTGTNAISNSVVNIANQFTINNTGVTQTTDVPNYSTTGTNGQILYSTGLGIQWGPAPTGEVTLIGTQTLTNKTLSSVILTGTLTANSTTGTNGQVLQSTGTGVQWATLSASTTNALTIGAGLSGTSFNGSSAVTIAIDSTVATLTGIQTLTNKTLTSPTINSATANNATLTGTLTAGGSVGTSGQVLRSTATGVQWATITTGTTTNALTIGTGLSGTSFNGSSAVTITIDSTVTTLTGTQTLTNKTLSSAILTGTLTANSTTGTNGQVLQSTGTGVQWATVSGAGDVTLTGTQTLTNKTLTAPTISSPTLTGTLTAGGGVGASGQVLQSTGTGIVWATVSGAAAVLNFDFGGFVRIFTDPVLYLLDKIGMDHGSFASPTEPSVNAGTF